MRGELVIICFFFAFSPICTHLLQLLSLASLPISRGQTPDCVVAGELTGWLGDGASHAPNHRPARCRACLGRRGTFKAIYKVEIQSRQSHVRGTGGFQLGNDGRGNASGDLRSMRALRAHGEEGHNHTDLAKHRGGDGKHLPTLKGLSVMGGFYSLKEALKMPRGNS
jgi:hypothetical protein